MADKDDTSTEEVTPAEVTEDDLRNLIGEEIDKRLSGISEGIGGLADSIVEKLKGEGSSDSDSLVEKIGGMIDEKLGKISSGGSGDKGNGKSTSERVPKIRIFS